MSLHKVRVATVKKTGTGKNGEWKLLNICLDESKWGSSFNTKFLELIGQEVNVDVETTTNIKNGTEYTNYEFKLIDTGIPQQPAVQQVGYVDHVPTSVAAPSKTVETFSPSKGNSDEWNRAIALKCAIAYCEIAGLNMGTQEDEVKKWTNVYLNYIKTGTWS